jgi:hypothetical protein
VKLETRFLTNNPCYKTNRDIEVRGLMLHSVGVNQPDPMVFIRSWDKPDYDRACVHGFIGAGDVYITLPCMEKVGRAKRGWHAGGNANNTHIGIEMTEPRAIQYTGGATFKVLDHKAATEFVRKTTQTAVELFAMLCAYHRLDPMKDIISHAEGCRMGLATNHGDPDHLWRGLGMAYNMDAFREAVNKRLREEIEMTKEELLSTEGTGDVPSPWAKEATEWAKKQGIFRGDGKGNYGWQQPITREAVAQALYNAFLKNKTAGG